MNANADFYAKAVASAPPPTMEGGASGYFSAPQDGLDPNLFDGTELRPDVRAWINRTLAAELAKLGLKYAARWTYVWLAGSGISYQWAADRGNGDLDVLFGVDYPSFLRANPDWGGMSEDQFANWLNDALRTDLWPRTAHQQFGGQAYEVTFYLNPGTGRDITNINPYAAYDLRGNRWTVTPPKVAADPASMYPQAWFNSAEMDVAQAQRLLERYGKHHLDLSGTSPGSPGWHNAGAALGLVTQQAQALWDEIHGGRHAAFQPGGHGYGDWANFRWQQAKRTGVVNALRGLVDVRETAGKLSDTELYGGPILSAEQALSRAALVSRDRPGLRR